MSKIKDNKSNLREEYKRRRDAFYSQLDSATRNLAFRRPPSPLTALLETANIIAIYASQGSEAPTNRLIEHLMKLGKTLAFPIVTGAAPLEFRSVSNIHLLKSGFMGIAEPSNESPAVEPDIIITPLIAFDRSMNRLGQGGGHYDRSFEKYPNAIRIGLAWSVQEAQKLPIEEHDKYLQVIITESELIQKVEMAS